MKRVSRKNRPKKKQIVLAAVGNQNDESGFFKAIVRRTYSRGCEVEWIEGPCKGTKTGVGFNRIRLIGAEAAPKEENKDMGIYETQQANPNHGELPPPPSLPVEVQKRGPAPSRYLTFDKTLSLYPSAAVVYSTGPSEGYDLYAAVVYVDERDACVSRVVARRTVEGVWEPAASRKRVTLSNMTLRLVLPSLEAHGTLVDPQMRSVLEDAYLDLCAEVEQAKIKHVKVKVPEDRAQLIEALAGLDAATWDLLRKNMGK